MRTRTQIDGDRLIVVHEENIGPHLAALKEARALRSRLPSRHTPPFRHAASIPMTVVLEWRKRGVDIFDPSPETGRKVRALLNGEFKYLKSTDGQV